MRKTFSRLVCSAFLAATVSSLSAAVGPWDSTVGWNGYSGGSVTDNGDGTYNMVVGGHEIWGGTDTGFYAYKQVTGDFDASVQILSEDYVDGAKQCDWARFGLMARITGNDATSPFIMLHRSPENQNMMATSWKRHWNADPGNNGASAISSTYTANWPNQFQRIIRRGTTLITYMNSGRTMADTGEKIWAIGNRVDTAVTYPDGTGVTFPDTIAIGMAGCSHSNVGTPNINAKVQNFSVVNTPYNVLDDYRGIHYTKWFPAGDLNAFNSRMDASQGDEVADSVTDMRNFDDRNMDNNTVALREDNDHCEQIWGVFVAPSTANYQFWLASDDESVLYLSNDEQPTGKTQITSRGGWCEYQAYPSDSVSSPVALSAGEKRYICARMHQGGGGGHLEVAVSSDDPVNPLTVVAKSTMGIPSSMFAPSAKWHNHVWLTPGPVSIPLNPVDTSVGAGKSYTFTAKADGTPPWTMKWQMRRTTDADFQDIPGATDWTYTATAKYPDDNDAEVRFVVAGPGEGNVATSATAILTVAPIPIVTDVILDPTYAVEGPSVAWVVYGVTMDAASALNTGNYSVSGGRTVIAAEFDAAHSVNGENSAVKLTFDAPLGYKGIVNSYTLTISDVYEGISATEVLSPNPTTRTLIPGVNMGKVRREWFTGLSDSTWVNVLVASTSYEQNQPNTTDFLTTLYSPQTSPDLNQYGLRMTGWIVPPTTGDYTFWIHADDEGRFYLSTDEDPAHLQLVVRYADGVCCGDGITSGVVPLEAGKAYYFEGLMMENGGGDYLEVQWTPPGGSRGSIPSANVFYAYMPEYFNPRFSTQPLSQAIQLGMPVTLTASAYCPEPGLKYQWFKDGTPIAGATWNTLTIPAVTTADYGIYQCLATNFIVTSSWWGNIPLAAFSDEAMVILDETPAAVSATAPASTEVYVRFSGAMDPTTATDSTKYSIDGGVTVLDAAFAPTFGYFGPQSAVKLTVTDLAPLTTYTLTVADVQNAAAATIVPNPANLTFVLGRGSPYYYASDFNQGLPQGASLSGNAVCEQGVVKLTSNVDGQAGLLVFPNVNGGQPVTAFTAKFKMRVFDGSQNPADGYSFNIGADVPFNVNAGAYENGATANGLSVCFIVYANNSRGIVVKWQNTVVAGTTKYLVDTYQSEPSSFRDVVIAMDTDGKLTVTYNGAVAFDHITGPWTPSKASVAIAARTGGESCRMWVDDVSLEFYNTSFPVDTTKPVLNYAVGINPLTAVATFSEPMAVALFDPTKWAVLDGAGNDIGVGITSVAPVPGCPNQASVTVNTPLTVGSFYTLKAMAVDDAGAWIGAADFYNNPVQGELAAGVVSAKTTFMVYANYTGRTVDMPFLPPTAMLPLGSKTVRGFDCRIVQSGIGLNNDTASMEALLAGTYVNNLVPQYNNLAPLPGFVETGIINYNWENNTQGRLIPDKTIPGYPRGVGQDNFAFEALAYVEITQPGLYHWGVNSDDGFRVQVLTDVSGAPYTTGITLGEFQGGRGAADSDFYFLAPEPGLYPIRLCWEEGGGGANCEFWNVDMITGAYTGINDDAGLKAFRVMTESTPAAPTITLGYEAVNGYVMSGKVSGDGPNRKTYSFMGESAGYGEGGMLNSSAILGTFKAGDKIQVAFLGSWDWNTVGSVPNWAVDNVKVDGATATLLSEDFTAGDGAFTVVNSAPAPTGQWIYDAGAGLWSAAGEPGQATQRPTWSQLTSPEITVAEDGIVKVTFNHRYSFEQADWDSGRVFVSVNGGAMQPVPPCNFVGDLKAGGGVWVMWTGDLPVYEQWVIQATTSLAKPIAWSDLATTPIFEGGKWYAYVPASTIAAYPNAFIQVIHRTPNPTP